VSASESVDSLTAINEQKRFSGIGPFIFNPVAALGVFLFPSFVQVGPHGHTNSHGHPHFSSVSDRVARRVVIVHGERGAGTTVRVCVTPFAETQSLPPALLRLQEPASPNGSKNFGGTVLCRRAKKWAPRDVARLPVEQCFVGGL
jgi:hypothetical protein